MQAISHFVSVNVNMHTGIYILYCKSLEICFLKCDFQWAVIAVSLKQEADIVQSALCVKTV